MSLALCIKLIRRHKLPRKIFCGIFDDDCAFQNPPSWKEKQKYFSSQPSFWKTELLISKEHTFYCNNIIYINSCDFFFSKRWGNNLTFSWTRYKSIFYFSPQKALMIEQKRRDHDHWWKIFQMQNDTLLLIYIVYLILDTDNPFSSVNSMQALHSSTT